MQLQLIEQILPNSNKILNGGDLGNKLIHPICYCYDMGTYRLEALLHSTPYKTPSADPSIIVDIKHDGEIPYQGKEKIQKLSIFFNYVQEFENAYDYENHETKINKVFMKNKIPAYYYRNKLLISSNGKNTKDIIKCIKNDSIERLGSITNEEKKVKRKAYLTNPVINIEKFMAYLIEEREANVKAIYAGDLKQKENKAIVIYGDQADKSMFYNFIKQQGSKLSCITIKMILNESEQPKTVLFNKDSGIMVFGGFSEENALRHIIKCNEILESFLNNGIYKNNN